MIRLYPNPEVREEEGESERGERGRGVEPNLGLRRVLPKLAGIQVEIRRSVVTAS